MTLAPLSTSLAAGALAPVTPADVAALLGVSLDAAQELCAEVRPLRVTRRGPPVWRWGAIVEHLERVDAAPAPPSPIPLAEVAPRRPGRRP